MKDTGIGSETLIKNRLRSESAMSETGIEAMICMDAGGVLSVWMDVGDEGGDVVF